MVQAWMAQKLVKGVPLWLQICDHLNYQLRDRLISFPFYVRSQCLIARNVRKLFSSNRSISHFYEACRINEVSRGSVSGPKILTGFGFGLPQVSQLKIVCCQCFVFSTKIIDHGGSRGALMQALARWRHPVASNKALDALHRAMRPVLHRRAWSSKLSLICLHVLPCQFCCWPQPKAKDHVRLI